MPDTFSGLNEEQALAVDSTRGPVLILAGSGTGKTQLLSIRACSILKKDKNILPGSYLNHLDISKESSEYVDEEELLGKSIDLTDMEDPFMGTEAILNDLISNLSLNPTRARKSLLNNFIRFSVVTPIRKLYHGCPNQPMDIDDKVILIYEFTFVILRRPCLLLCRRRI